MRPSKNVTWMRIATELGKQSTCARRQVGCVLLNKRGHVLSTGYNGVHAGAPHCTAQSWFRFDQGFVPLYPGQTSIDKPCEGALSKSGEDLDLCKAIHAEQNALLQCSDVQEIHTCYVTASPCMHCMKLLLNTSCQDIHYLEAYDSLAIDLWIGDGRLIFQGAGS